MSRFSQLTHMWPFSSTVFVSASFFSASFEGEKGSTERVLRMRSRSTSCKLFCLRPRRSLMVLSRSRNPERNDSLSVRFCCRICSARFTLFRWFLYARTPPMMITTAKKSTTNQILTRHVCKLNHIFAVCKRSLSKFKMTEKVGFSCFTFLARPPCLT